MKTMISTTRLIDPLNIILYYYAVEGWNNRGVPRPS